MCKSEDRGTRYGDLRDETAAPSCAVQQSVRGHLENEIKKFECAAGAFRDLLDNLPAAYLNSPASRLTALSGVKP